MPHGRHAGPRAALSRRLGTCGGASLGGAKAGWLWDDVMCLRNRPIVFPNRARQLRRTNWPPEGPDMRFHRRLFESTCLVFSACMPLGGGGGGGSGDAGGGPTVPNVTDEARVEVHGRVSDGEAPLSAVVSDTVGGLVAEAGSNGRYSLTASVRETPRGRRALLSFSRDGYAPFLGSVIIKPGVTSYSLDARLAQLTEVEVAPGEARTVTVDTPHGTVSVQVPAVSNAGTRIRVAGVSAQDSPGEMRDATAGRDQALQSNGMVYVDMVGPDDEPLPPPPGFGVDAMNPPAELPPEAEPEPVEEFGLNEDGQWAPQPPDQPREFGWWNADRNFRTACVRGVLATPQGACAGGRVTATGPDGLSSRDNTGADGSFCVTGAQTFQSTLSTAGGNRNVQMPANAGDCSAPETCTDLGSVVVGDGQCDGETTGEPPMTPEDCGFDCGDGTCIAADRACNRAQDCANGSDEADAVCGNPDSCCTATRGCPGETGASCANSCCCCPSGQACCPNPADGCCASN